MDKYLFINGSMNRNGRTARMAEILLDGKEYDTINLMDYKVVHLGQEKDGDRFMDIINAMRAADTIVIGSPVYWFTMSSLLKTVVDRLYELQGTNIGLDGKKMAFIFQGAAPTRDAIRSTSYIFEQIAGVLNMKFVGTASDEREAQKIASGI